MIDKDFSKKSIFRYLKKIKFNTKILITNDRAKMNLKSKIKLYEEIFLKNGVDESEQNERKIKIFNPYGNLKKSRKKHQK